MGVVKWEWWREREKSDGEEEGEGDRERGRERERERESEKKQVYKNMQCEKLQQKIYTYIPDPGFGPAEK